MRRPLNAEELEFVKELGETISALRQERGLSQAKLGEMIGQSQQQVNAFEKGGRRIPVTCLPRLAAALDVSLERLLGVQQRKRGPGRASKLERQLEQLAMLPKAKQRFVSEMLDTVLKQAS